MFCPKCGIKNPETGKFCRSCGTDLSSISEALSGKSNNKKSGFGMLESIQPMQSVEFFNKKDKTPTLEAILPTIFTGIAFLIISIILGVTGVAGGKFWWFWLLIPAFGSLGTGFAQYIQYRKKNSKSISDSGATENVKSFNQTPNVSLPPTQTDYVAPDSRYKTGDLVPPSVVEGTTRHLEINSEGETMTLPKK